MLGLGRLKKHGKAALQSWRGVKKPEILRGPAEGVRPESGITVRTSEAFETVREKVNMALTALTLDWAQGWVARVGNGRQRHLNRGGVMIAYTS